MPQGEGTYGSQVGRPSTKKKKKNYIGRTSRTGEKKSVDMKKKYAGKKFTPLIGRGTPEERKNTREFAKDLENNRKAKNKKRLKKFKAFVKRATDPRGTKAHDKDPKGKTIGKVTGTRDTDPRGTKAHDKDPKGTTIGKTTKAGKKFIKKQTTNPFARKKPDPESANKLMKKLNKGK